jgi:hypothetical protein
MTKVIMEKEKNGVEFGRLSAGDCFLDKDNFFCIKVNSVTCLYTRDDMEAWEVSDDCDSFEEVFPIDVEIHVVS